MLKAGVKEQSDSIVGKFQVERMVLGNDDTAVVAGRGEDIKRINFIFSNFKKSLERGNFSDRNGFVFRMDFFRIRLIPNEAQDFK